ncbi:hypothetical protein HK102_010446 [Quaeritorhiza haematococci]|nr:hypothetical protein HK102_010446 [Quaeritorhiza haematococci]
MAAHDTHDCKWKTIALTALAKLVNFEFPQRRHINVENLTADKEDARLMREWALKILFKDILSEFPALGEASSTSSHKDVIKHVGRRDHVPGPSLALSWMKPFLPYDVVSIIIKNTDRVTLSSCALVNREWASLARPILWKPCNAIQRFPEVDSMKGFTFLHTLYETSSPRSFLPHVASFITSVSFCVSQFSLEPICRALSGFRPHLKTLRLVGCVQRNFLDRIIDHCPQTVAHFGVENWEMDARGSDDDQQPNYDSNKYRQFFSRFETLTLSNIPDRDMYLEGAHHGLRVAILPSCWYRDDFIETFIARDFV